jgi:hypothetical protein
MVADFWIHRGCLLPAWRSLSFHSRFPAVDLRYPDSFTGRLSSPDAQ